MRRMKSPKPTSLLSSLLKNVETELILPSFIVCFGFSISLVNAGKRWDRAREDKILRLEKCFPKCRKQTIGGMRDGFGLSQDVILNNIKTVKILILF